MVLNRSVTLFLPFLCSASDGLERTPFLLKETWTPLPLVEAGNDFFFTVSSLAVSFKDFILSRIYSACVTNTGKKEISLSSPLFASFFLQRSLWSVGG